jgi:3-keto-disaccharide hydrolase
MRCLTLMLCLLLPPVRGEEPAWVELVGEKAGDVWKGPMKGWATVGGVGLDAKNPRQLASQPGKGVLVNSKEAQDLISKESFGDLEIEVEFCIPKGSNSGVKFNSLYEIQILDSYGQKGELTGDSCGGIYPRAELLPRYRYLDKGVPPKENVCRAPGEWQKLHAIFLAPRFDKGGKKTANARIVKATLNGTLIHDDVELKWPTGHNWTKKEVAKAPLLLQGDHGPVAFRNVRVRAYRP